MKRFWIGLSVLAVLLATSIGVTVFIQRSHSPIYEDLALAAQAALAGDWNSAPEIAARARQRWDSCNRLTAAFIDHSILEEAEALFAEIDTYAAAQDPVSFAAACAHLSRLAKAIAESHLPIWQNLL